MSSTVLSVLPNDLFSSILLDRIAYVNSLLSFDDALVNKLLREKCYLCLQQISDCCADKVRHYKVSFTYLRPFKRYLMWSMMRTLRITCLNLHFDIPSGFSWKLLDNCVELNGGWWLLKHLSNITKHLKQLSSLIIESQFDRVCAPLSIQ